MAVLKVHEPPLKRSVDLRDDLFEAVPIRALRLTSDRFLQLLDALLAWPLVAPLKVVSQKVKPTTLGGIHNPRLLQVQA